MSARLLHGPASRFAARSRLVLIVMVAAAPVLFLARLPVAIIAYAAACALALALARHLLAPHLAAGSPAMADDLRALRAKLAESERLQQILARNTTDIVTLMMPSEGITYVSAACVAVLGYAPEELLGDRLAGLWHPDDRHARAETLRQLWAGEIDSASQDRRVLHKDGRWLWLEVKFRLVRDAATAAPVAIITAARDISARIAAEQTLREQEAMLRLLADNVTDMIVLLDRDFRRIYVSPACNTLFGYTQDEMLQQADFRDGMHPDDVPDVLARTRLLRDRERFVSMTYRRRRRDGQYIWVNAAARRLEADGGIVMVIRDISELKRTEAELREREGLLRVLADNASDIIMLTGPDLRRRYVSPACREIIGFSPEELLQQDVRDGVHPDELPNMLAGLERLANGAPTATMTYRRLRQDGDYVWLSNVTRKLDGDGGYVSVIRDLTEIRQAEAELRAQRSFFQSLFDSTTDGLIVMRVTPAGGFVVEVINQASLNDLGVTADSALGRSLDAFLPAPASAGMLRELETCLAVRQPVRRVVHGQMGEGEPGQHKTGQRETGQRETGQGGMRPHASWEVVFVPMMGADGAVERILVTAHDITRLQQAERASAESNRWLTLAEEIAGLGHWRMLVPSHELTWSPQVYRIFDLDPAAPPPDAEAVLARYHPDDRPLIRQGMIGVITEKKPLEIGAKLLRPTGGVRHVQSRLVPEFDRDGAVTSVFGILMDVTDQVKAQTELREARDLAQSAQAILQEMALEDALTGLANRRRFDGALSDQLRRAARDDTALGLALFDVDQFKLFNDRYGHVAGDECLRAVAVAMQACLWRPTDLACRYGGEEFAVLLPVTNLDGAETVADDIRRAIRSLLIPHAGSPHGVVTISAGVAVIAPGRQPVSAADLIRMADSALYDAKALGRDRVRIHLGADASV